MKILPDECLPFGLRHSFPGHETNTVEWAGFKGKAVFPGRLLQAPLSPVESTNEDLKMKFRR